MIVSKFSKKESHPDPFLFDPPEFSERSQFSKVFLNHESNHTKFNAPLSYLSSLKKMEKRDVKEKPLEVSNVEKTGTHIFLDS